MTVACSSRNGNEAICIKASVRSDRLGGLVVRCVVEIMVGPYPRLTALITIRRAEPATNSPARTKAANR